MLEKVKKILTYVFLPITGLIFLFKFYMDFTKNKADKSLQNTQKKDSDLQQQEDSLKTEAKIHIVKAEELQKQTKEENTDADWHKKN